MNQDKKVRRIDFLPIRRKVNTIVLHRDYVLISLDRLGKTGHSSDRIRQRIRELIDYIIHNLVHKKLQISNF